MAGTGKPTIDDLGIVVESLDWRRSDRAEGALEVAMVQAGDARWVLLRVAGDLSRRVLVYSEHEWECFLDGAKRGEFDDALG